jgi:glycosyltransferase involved in cell wall biosynthesis
MKIFFIVPYPTEGASNRFRVEQYLPYLRSKNIQYEVRPFISRKFYKILYLRRHYFKKIFYFLINTLNRIIDILRLLRYDLVFIHREAFLMGPPFFEYVVSKLKKPIIYDFDDAIFLPDTSEYNSFVERFKRPDKISTNIRLSDYVIAGNKYLQDYALRYNDKVTIIPTSINTDIYRHTWRFNKSYTVIGWMGSNTTVKFLKLLRNVFKELIRRYPNIEIRIIGGDFSINGVPNIKSQKWSMEKELRDLEGFDIGIMPMPDNEWTKGKCGFKAILYMSMGIPCVCSPVGVNKEIITDGVNGFLADSDEEWIEKLSMLIENPGLRQRLGSAGRITVEEEYSVKVNVPKFLEVLEKVYKTKLRKD